MDQNQNTEKTLTKYDRKVLERQKARQQEKRRQILTVIISAVVVLALVGLAVVLPAIKKNRTFKNYVKINGSSVSALEFNFYKSSVMNNYSQLLPYLGLDTSKSFDEQIYDESTGMTWADFFDQQAVITARETRALLDDAKAKGFTYDAKEEYKTTLSNMKAAAKEAKLTFQNYLLSVYGSFATEKRLKPILTDQMTASAYYSHLSEQFAPTDEAVQKEYDDNKAKYDSVDYRMLPIRAKLPEGATDEQKATAIAEAKASAEAMLEKLKAGEDFETLCATYADEDTRADYADTATDKSLFTGLTQSSSYVLYNDWLFSDDRVAGDVFIHAEEDTGIFYVVKFEKRYLGEDTLTSIKNNLTFTVVSEYVDALVKNYTITDPKGNVKFLPTVAPTAIPTTAPTQADAAE